MKSLTLYPEHAEAFRLGLRTWETRSWSTDYAGAVAIVAGKRDPDGAAARRDVLSQRAMSLIPHGDPLTRGAITVVADLVDVVPIIETDQPGYDGAIDAAEAAGVDRALVRNGHHLHHVNGRTVAYQPGQELALGNFVTGNFAWGFKHPRTIDPPVPMRGHLGLRDLPGPELVHVISRLERPAA